MEFTDMELTCAQCGASFIFTADEQLFFHEKGFTNLPRRCPACRVKRAPTKAAGKTAAKRETVAVCASCGKETTVPFRPTKGQPVLCRKCFAPKANHGE